MSPTFVIRPYPDPQVSAGGARAAQEEHDAGAHQDQEANVEQELYGLHGKSDHQQNEGDNQGKLQECRHVPSIVPIRGFAKLAGHAAGVQCGSIQGLFRANP